MSDMYSDKKNREQDRRRTNLGPEEEGSQILSTIEESASRVRETVSDATEQVRDQVKGGADQVRGQIEGAATKVREQAQEVAEQVQGFDVSQQVRSHPWMALGVAALAGYCIGSMGGDNDDDDHDYQVREQELQKARRRAEEHQWASRSPQVAGPAVPHMPYAAGPRPFDPTYGNGPANASFGRPEAPVYQRDFAQAQSSSYQPQESRSRSGRSNQSSSMWDSVVNQFGSEIRTLATAAVGTAIAVMRDTVTEHVPQFEEEYERRSKEREESQPKNRSTAQNPQSSSQPFPSRTETVNDPLAGHRNKEEFGNGNKEEFRG